MPGVFTPGITLQRISITSAGHSYPYPELLEVLHAGAAKTRGTGTACVYLPGSSGSSVRPCHNTTIPAGSGSFERLSYPYPELLEVLQDFHSRTRNFCELCKTRATIPGVRVHHVLYPPGTSVSFVCPCHNTRNFWKFGNTSIPVPETSGSSGRPP